MQTVAHTALLACERFSCFIAEAGLLQNQKMPIHLYIIKPSEEKSRGTVLHISYE